MRKGNLCCPAGEETAMALHPATQVCKGTFTTTSTVTMTTGMVTATVIATDIAMDIAMQCSITPV